MTNLPSLPIASSRRSTFAAAFLVALAALLALATGAGAQVVPDGSTTVGLSPRVGAPVVTEPKTYANPEGNPVLHREGTYAIYWDPTDHFHNDWQDLIDNYLANVGAASGALNTIFSVDAQYTDKTNVPASFNDVFHGAYTDTTPYPTSECTDPDPFEKEDLIGSGETQVCLTSAQIASQLESFLSSHGLPRGMTSVYYLMTPPGVAVCLDKGGPKGRCSDYTGTKESYDNSFCSYHAAINPGGLATGDANTILYGVVPWTAGGYGDFHLLSADRRPGWECQDGGYDPTKKEELEKAKEKNKEEIKKFEEMDAEEKAKAEALVTAEGPHAQEPNQQKCPTEDGSCDYGLADLIINQLSLVQQDIVTDPLLNAWQDKDHSENTDECRFFFAPAEGSSAAAEESLAGSVSNQSIGGSYYLNDAFNLAGLRLPFPGVGCLEGISLEPRFTAPNTVNAGETVGFDGMQSDITLDAGIHYPGAGAPAANYATYTWNFGDGTSVKGYAPGAPVCEANWLSPCAASAFHAYTYGGTYTVTLTVDDVAGDQATVSHQVTVVGPPPPAPAPAPATTPAAATGSTPGGTATPTPDPVAAEAVLSHSLKTALHRGLTVRYTVNEQVAGRFEVLISASLARTLHLGGAPATGLPAGTSPQVLIARDVLVTTKAGGSTIQIKFSKSVAARLRRAHNLPLLLRMFVRDAAKSPATTTVLSAVTLFN